MVGFCKYCGFVGTNEQMMGHAENCPPDGQPDTMEENGSSHNSESAPLHGDAFVEFVDE